MTYADAERWILDLELFGMRFGLERMRRLMTVLGTPQQRFRTVHVVGSNGKSSTVRMAAALLREHGLRTGAYLSPHFVDFTERVRIDDQDVVPERFAAAAERVRAAAAKVDRSQPDGEDRVTQFEALTAIGFVLMADAEVEVAVIEAGLGGRYDATNVIGADVVALTNVGLEHTRWLGPTIDGIAKEKLAVVRPGAALVVGHGLHPDARAVADGVPKRHLIEAPESIEGVDVFARGAHQQRNFACAAAAAEALLGRALDSEAVARAARTAVPGRFEEIGQRPLTILDGAHNPDGMAALATVLPRDRKVVAALSILDDKDAAKMLSELDGIVDAIVCTTSANPRSLPAGTVHTIAAQLGFDAEVEPDPHRALARARELSGPDGIAVATGSLYLLADLKRTDRTRRASML